jgi:hypothetical protein
MKSSEVNRPELPGSLGKAHVRRNGRIVEPMHSYVET